VPSPPFPLHDQKGKSQVILAGVAFLRSPFISCTKHTKSTFFPLPSFPFFPTPRFLLNSIPPWVPSHTLQFSVCPALGIFPLYFVIFLPALPSRYGAGPLYKFLIRPLPFPPPLTPSAPQGASKPQQSLLCLLFIVLIRQSLQLPFCFPADHLFFSAPPKEHGGFPFLQAAVPPSPPPLLRWTLSLVTLLDSYPSIRLLPLYGFCATVNPHAGTSRRLPPVLLP